MEILTLSLTITFLSVFAWFQYKLNKRIIRSIKDGPTPQITPNKITGLDSNVVELTEGNPLDLPNDVKVEVEGGDTHLPPQYEFTPEQTPNQIVAE